MPLSLNTDTDASKNNGEPFYNTEAGEKQEQKKQRTKKWTFLLHNTRVALAENTQVKRFAYKASFFLIKNTLQRLHPSFFFTCLPPLPSVHKCHFPLKWRFSWKLHPLKRTFLLHTVVLFFFFFFCFLIPSCDSRGLK